MLKCVIVDDEEAAVDLLKIYIAKVSYLELAFATTEPIDGLDYLQKNEVDLVFLDITMPDISGFGFAKLALGKAKVVFTTGYSEFAVDSYKYNALDYLMKPISFDNFLNACQKALPSTISTSLLEPQKNIDDYFFVKTEHKGKITKIMFKDILYVEGLKNYVSIYTEDREQIITLLTMKEVEEHLPKTSFFRPHKSYIVSLEKIRAIDGNEIILMNHKDKIPLGPTYRESLFNYLTTKILATRGEKVN